MGPQDGIKAYDSPHQAYLVKQRASSQQVRDTSIATQAMPDLDEGSRSKHPNPDQEKLP